MPTQNQASEVKQVSHAMSSTNAVVVQPLDLVDRRGNGPSPFLGLHRVTNPMVVEVSLEFSRSETNLPLRSSRRRSSLETGDARGIA